MNLTKNRTYVVVVPNSDPNSIYEFAIISGLAGQILNYCVNQAHVERTLRANNYHAVASMRDAADLYLQDQERNRAGDPTVEAAR